MTSHHTKFQLDSSKRSQVIPLQKRTNDDDDDNNDNDDDTHPPRIILRVGMIFRRGQKMIESQFVT